MSLSLTSVFKGVVICFCHVFHTQLTRKMFIFNLYTLEPSVCGAAVDCGNHLLIANHHELWCPQSNDQI